MGLTQPAPELRLGFADTAAAIRCEDPGLFAALQGIFRHCPASAEPAVTYSITCPRSGLWLTERAGQVIRQDMQTLDVLEGLMHDLVAQFITHTRGQPVFHAAGVESGGKALLLVAESGAGKSSLAGWLVSQGLRYLTDEIIAWDEASSTVCGLPRPLVLKRGAAPLWQGWLAAVGTLGQAKPFGNGTLWLDPELLHPDAVCPSAAPGLLIFSRFSPGASFQAERLTQAKAVFSLMQHLVNGPNLPGEGFESAASLAVACPAYRLEYGVFSAEMLTWLVGELNCH